MTTPLRSFGVDTSPAVNAGVVMSTTESRPAGRAQHCDGDDAMDSGGTGDLFDGSPAYADSVVYTHGFDAVEAYRASDGTLLWSADDGSQSRWSPPSRTAGSTWRRSTACCAPPGGNHHCRVPTHARDTPPKPDAATDPHSSRTNGRASVAAQRRLAKLGIPGTSGAWSGTWRVMARVCVREIAMGAALCRACPHGDQALVVAGGRPLGVVQSGCGVAAVCAPAELPRPVSS